MKYISNFINISVLAKHPSKLTPGSVQFVIVGRKRALKTANLEAATTCVEPRMILMICS